MKKGIFILSLIGLLTAVYFYKEPIADYIYQFLKEEQTTSAIQNNEEAKDTSFQYVSLTRDFIADDKQEILNIIYTVINSGMDQFTFYCSKEYTSCMNDIDLVSKDRVVLSNINNFVHPYNSFTDMETTRYESSGKIVLAINHLYSSEQKKEIDQKIDQIMKDNITSDMTDKDKIKVIHDYIIENTKYDTLRSDQNLNTYQSDTAYGPLFQGYGICNGYSDLMNLFLSKLGIPSIKVSSENHIWNLVFLDNSWYHLDLTWDDPVMENGKDIVDYSYFLITTNELFDLQDDQHYFDESVYKEVTEK